MKIVRLRRGCVPVGPGPHGSIVGAEPVTTGAASVSKHLKDVADVVEADAGRLETMGVAALPVKRAQWNAMRDELRAMIR